MTETPDVPARPLAAVVLAAGKGTRMNSSRHKVLHEIAGRPMIEHLLASLAELAPERTVVVVGDGRDQLEAQLAGRADFVVQEPQLGTGHAVQQAEAALKDFEDKPERWLDLRWDIEERTPQRFPARIMLQTVNEPGTLVQVAQVIAEHDGNIDNIRMTRQSPDFTSLIIDLEVYDLKHLNSIIAQLRAKDVVASAERADA